MNTKLNHLYDRARQNATQFTTLEEVVRSLRGHPLYEKPHPSLLRVSVHPEDPRNTYYRTKHHPSHPEDQQNICYHTNHPLLHLKVSLRRRDLQSTYYYSSHQQPTSPPFDHHRHIDSLADPRLPVNHFEHRNPTIHCFCHEKHPYEHSIKSPMFLPYGRQRAKSMMTTALLCLQISITAPMGAKIRASNASQTGYDMKNDFMSPQYSIPVSSIYQIHWRVIHVRESIVFR
jgi:hypothetical protein